MSDPQCFAIIPLDGPPPAEAIVIGGLDEIMQFLPQTVAHQELESRALGLVDQLTKREQAFNDGLAALAPSIGRFMDMCERLVAGEEALRAEQIRLDEEAAARAEQEQILQYLETHPEPASLSDDTHHPGGELHSLDPVDKETKHVSDV